MSASRDFRRSILLLGELDVDERRWAYNDIAMRLDDLAAARMLAREALEFMQQAELQRGRTSNLRIKPLRTPRVFLSHNHADKRFVRNLARELSEHGVHAWIDEAELAFGDSLIERLRDAIDQVDLVLVVISKSSVNSKWVQKEVDVAMNQEIHNRRVKVIPIMRQDCELPGFLKGKLYADFTSKYRRRKNLPKLIDSILHHTKPS